MTLADELRALEQRLRDEGLREFADEVDALAAKVEGKCLVKAETESETTPGWKPTGRHIAYLVLNDSTGYGDTPHEAIANLQALLDGER